MSEFKLGQLEARVDSNDARLDRMEAKIDTMYEIITKARGSWKAMVGLGGMFTALGALLAKVWPA